MSDELCFYATSVKNKKVSIRDTNELEDLPRHIIAVYEILLYLDYKFAENAKLVGQDLSKPEKYYGKGA